METTKGLAFLCGLFIGVLCGYCLHNPHQPPPREEQGSVGAVTINRPAGEQRKTELLRLVPVSGRASDTLSPDEWWIEVDGKVFIATTR